MKTMAAKIFLVVSVLFTGCTDRLPRAPRPESMEPGSALQGAETPVTIRGRDFYPGVKISYTDDSRSYLSSSFSAYLGEVELLEVTYVDSTALTATVPASLDPDTYDLIVKDPEERIGVLENAFTVLPAVSPPECTLNPPRADAGSLAPLSCDEAKAGVVIGGSPTARAGLPPYTYEWTPGTGLDDPYLPNPTAALVTDASYQVVVSDAFACTASDSIDIEVLTPVAALMVNPGHGCFNPAPPPDSTRFSFSAGGSSGTPGLCYSFDFGDGDSTGLQNSPSAIHAYASEGIFTATLTVQDECAGDCSSCSGCLDLATSKVYVSTAGNPSGEITFDTADTPPGAGDPCNVDYWITFTSSMLSEGCQGGIMGAGLEVTVEPVRGTIPVIEDQNPGLGGIQLLTDATSRVSFHLCADRVGGHAVVMARVTLGAAQGTAATTFAGSASLPTVKEFGPSGHTDIVAPWVVARFDKDMDPATIDILTFKVKDPSMADLEGTLDYDPDSRTATFVPASPFDEAGNVYTVHLQNEILDLFGNSLDGDYDGVAEGIAEDRFAFTFGATTDETPPSRTCETISPDPFSPDGDGVDDVATIPVTVSDETGMWLVRAVIRGPEPSSARVRTLALPLGTSGTADLAWDGRNEAGEVVSNGVYESSAEAFDAAGNRSATCNRQVTVSGALDPAEFR